MNSINLTGRICNDVEAKTTQGGKMVMQVNLAVKRPFTKDITDFIPLVIWEQKAEFLSNYAQKGSMIAVSGKLTSRRYQDSKGNNRTAYEVVCETVELLDSKDKSTNGTTAPTYNATTPPAYEEVETDEHLPF